MEPCRLQVETDRITGNSVPTLMQNIPFLRLVLALSTLACLEARSESSQKIDAAKYATLQEAVDALPAAGGMVVLPPGRHELLQPLVIRTEATRLVGAGPATHLVNTNEEGQPAIHLRSDAYQGDAPSRLWRVQLDNFRVSGNPKSGDGILAQGINEILIENVSIDHHGGHGIALIDCYEDPRISDSILTYNAKAGLDINGGHDIVVNANQFEENQDGIRCYDSFNLTCNGNNFDDHLRHGIVIENTYGSVVSGNMIEECQGMAMVLDRDCYGITVSANVIAHEFEGGIDLRDAWGCAISANTFTIVHQFSLRVGPESGRLTVTGNQFSNSYMGRGQHKRDTVTEQKARQDTGTGMVLDGAEDLVITGNSFTGMDGKAITILNPCRRLAITGNLVTDYGRKQPTEHAIDRPGDEASLVANNLITRRP